MKKFVFSLLFCFVTVFAFSAAPAIKKENKVFKKETAVIKVLKSQKLLYAGFCYEVGYSVCGQEVCGTLCANNWSEFNNDYQFIQALCFMVECP